MMITRPLLALATLIALALPTAAAAESQSLDHPRQEEPAVEERPRDLPPWLFASRLGRPLEDRPGDAAGLSAMSGVLLRDAPGTRVKSDPLTLRSTGEDDSSDLRVLLGRGERWHLMRFGANAASGPQEAKVTAYGAVAYVPPGLAASRPGGGGVAGRRLRPGPRRAGGTGRPGPQGLGQRLRGRRRVPLGRQAVRAPGERAAVAAGPGGHRALDRAAAGPRAPAPVAVRPVRQRGSQPGAAPHHADPDRGLRGGHAAGLADLRADLRQWRFGPGVAERGRSAPGHRGAELRQSLRQRLLRRAALGHLGLLDLHHEPRRGAAGSPDDDAVPRCAPHAAAARRADDRAVDQHRPRPLRMVGDAEQHHLGLAAAVLRAPRELVEPLDARRLHRLPGHRRHRGLAHHEPDRRASARARPAPRRADQPVLPGGGRAPPPRGVPRTPLAPPLRPPAAQGGPLPAPPPTPPPGA